MKVKLERDRLIIEPESPTDIAFIEDTLNVPHGGDYLKLTRHDTTSTKSVWPFVLIAASRKGPA